ncbi:hypothetical protein [Streptomyces mirabilis]|uniref:hypothetical protein n=1 Tax=Streptomyces mirabilis TaxID=68239 RepID=UPI0036521DCB
MKAKIRSDSCGLEQLIAAYDEGRIRDRLMLGDGWPRRWSGTWLVGEGEVIRRPTVVVYLSVLIRRAADGWRIARDQASHPG